MKRYRKSLPLLIVVLMLLGQAPRASAAPIVNPDFDNGDLAGWNFSPAAGGGSVDAVPSFLYVAEGPRLAILRSGTPGAWTTLTQTFDVPPGSEMGCKSFFVASSTSADDSGQVRLLSGNSIAVATFDYNGAMLTPTNHWTPVISWTHVFTITGRYTIEARVRDAGAGTSYLGLDSCYVNQRLRLPTRQPIPPR